MADSAEVKGTGEDQDAKNNNLPGLGDWYETRCMDAVTGPMSVRIKWQKTIKPGILLPGFRFPHNWKERWTVPDADPEDVTKDIGVAADRMMMGAEDGYIYHLDELRYSVSGKIGHATLIILTKSRWMDMVDFEVRKPADGGAGSVVLAHGYSTGFLPVSIPLAPILNIPLCILPFSDGMVIRKKWMAGIQKHMQTGAILVEGSGGYQL